MNPKCELCSEIERLTKDLALNASMLARQCDLARQAETERGEARAELAAAAETIESLRALVARQTERLREMTTATRARARAKAERET